MEDVQRCARTDDLDLEKIIAIAVGYEGVNASVSGLQTASEGRHINYTAAEHSRKAFGKPAENESDDSNQAEESRCKRYGGNEHRDKADCRAMGKTCNKCGKANHFANVCRSKVDQKPSNSGGSKGGKDGKWQYKQSGDKHLNQIGEESNSSSRTCTVEEESYAQYLRYMEALHS
jgi:hypothetical protein